MRGIRRVYSWVIVSIMLQTAFLAYINFAYLGDGSPIKTTLYHEGNEKPISTQVKIPDKADGIKVSYNGSYAAYISESKLEIFDIKNRKSKRTFKAGNGSFTFYRWLADRNILIYSKAVPDIGKSRVEVSTYDPGLDLLRSYPIISGLPEASEVVSIELSTITNIVYLKVNVSESRADIYKYNIMDELKYVINVGINTMIKETIYNDNLVYQDDSSRINIRDGENNSTRVLSFEDRIVLLDIDSQDNIFIGKLNDENKVTKVCFGSLDEDFEKEWAHMPMEVPVMPDSIVITQSGDIYELSEREKALNRIGGGESIPFSGKFIEVLNDYIVTKDGKYLKLAVNTG